MAAFASMVGLTLTNPATILSFAALFASIGAGTGGPAGARRGRRRRVPGLRGLVGDPHRRRRGAPCPPHARVVRWLNIVAAAMIGAFGVVAIAIGLGVLG